MKDLAPQIIRERLLIEGFFTVSVTKETISLYFKEITFQLSLRMYGEPIIFSPEGLGREENQGFDAFVPLVDSGISLYVWTSSKFFSVIMYTCKKFDAEKAIQVTSDFFKVTEIESQSF